MSGRSRWPSLVVAVVAATAIAGSHRPGAATPEPGPVAAARVTPSWTPQVSFPTRTVRDADGDTLLADASGRALQLHGANLGKTDDITERDVADLGAAGFTLLRLPIQWSKLEPTQGGHDAAYLQHIEDVLAWADRYGLLVIVDWHQDVYGPYFPGFDGARVDHPHRRQGLHPDPGNWFNNYFDPAVTAASPTCGTTRPPGPPGGRLDLPRRAARGITSPAGLRPVQRADVDLERLRRQRAPGDVRPGDRGIRTVDQRPGCGSSRRCSSARDCRRAPPDIDDPRHGADRVSATPRTPTPPLSRTAATSTSRAAGSRPTSR